MTVSTRFLTGVAISALMAGQAAADVTPEEVWQSWVGLAEASGQTVTEGARSRQGDTLLLTDVTGTGTADAAGFSYTIPQVSLRDMGDGRVEMTTAATSQLSGYAKDDESRQQDITGTVTQSGLKVIVSGTPEAMNFDYEAAALDYTMNVAVPQPDTGAMAIGVKLAKLAGSYQSEQRDSGYATGGTGQFDGITVTLKGDVTPGENSETQPGTVDMALSYGPSTVEHSSFLSTGTNYVDLAAALKAGAEGKAKIVLGPASYRIEGTDPESGAFALTGSNTGSHAEFGMGDGQLLYDVVGNDLAMSVISADLPFPVEFGIEKMGVKLSMPATKTAELTPFVFGVDLTKLALSDSIWAMADPMGKLAHDPLSLQIDLDGTTTMPVDLFDPESADDIAPFAGGDLNINTVMLDALGANVQANGKLTMPAAETGLNALPVGEITAKASGLNALLDNLVAMGLLPEDQVMGARMMMALFTQPDGEDGLSSRIEFREDGGIYANGQRIQ